MDYFKIPKIWILNKFINEDIIRVSMLGDSLCIKNIPGMLFLRWHKQFKPAEHKLLN